MANIDDLAQPEPEAETETGWQVLDPDGNVVESGPGVMLEAVSDTGEEQPDGGDR